MVALNVLIQNKPEFPIGDTVGIQGGCNDPRLDCMKVMKKACMTTKALNDKYYAHGGGGSFRILNL